MISGLHGRLLELEILREIEKESISAAIQDAIHASGYELVEVNDQKPWGAYFRMHGDQADDFITEFFPGLTPAEARLGIDNAQLSPKILLVAPSQRLSWQYHDRRAERWAFLTHGGYNKSHLDEPGDVFHAVPHDVVQFARSERHRLVGKDDHYTLVAEIWQHVDPDQPSDEDDIIRLYDDYKR